MSTEGAFTGVRFRHVMEVFIKTAVTGNELNSGFVVFSVVFQ